MISPQVPIVALSNCSEFRRSEATAGPALNSIVPQFRVRYDGSLGERLAPILRSPAHLIKYGEGSRCAHFVFFEKPPP